MAAFCQDTKADSSLYQICCDLRKGLQQFGLCTFGHARNYTVAKLGSS